MKRYFIIFSIFIAVALSVGTALTIDLPHELPNNINCLSCHSIHGYLGKSLTKTAAINDLCATCHYDAGPATDATTHQTQDCVVCHEPHLQEQNNAHGTNYGKLIKTSIQTPSSGVQPITFRNATEFVDGLGNGICEVCHTDSATINYYLNDGSGDHPDYGGGLPGSDCINCHSHISATDAFSPSGGGTSGAHVTHTSEIYGPDLVCADCHGAQTPPLLSDSQNLAGTTVCDNCHSADGVSNAKTYWPNSGSSIGTAGSWLVVLGDKSYCGSCHDQTPGNTQKDGLGTDAQDKVGNDSTYGNYVTGHGKSAGNYAKFAFQLTAESGNAAANQGCGACHDTTAAHFTAGASTRIKTGFADDVNNSNCQQCHEPGSVASALIQDYQTYAGFSSTAHGSAKCSTCHEYHGMDVGGNEGMTFDVAPTRCTTCHDGVTATAASTHQTLDCAICHNPHSQEGANLNLVRGSVKINATTESATVFTATTGTNSFADGDATYNGVCEVCHTTTAYHRNNASGNHAHNTGTDCSLCHSHASGFATTGADCLACHDSIQGSRRQIVGAGGDFQRTSHHVTGGSLQTADCEVCHDNASHQSGTVYVSNVDTGASIQYTNAASLEPFCTACHDANGANGNTTPFSDGVTVPNISDWPTSPHDTAGKTCFGDGATTGCHSNAHGSDNSDILTVGEPPKNNVCYSCHTSAGINGIYGGKTTYESSEHWSDTDAYWRGPSPSARPASDYGKCLNCHSPHGYNDGSGLVPGLAVAREENLCLNCHDGTLPSPVANIQTELNKTYSHPVSTSGKHNQSEGSNSASFGFTPTDNRHAECADCHNPHVAKTGAAAAPAASDRIKGVSGVNSSGAYVANITNEYELCYKCHSSWTTRPGGQDDMATLFDTGNQSYHPVEAQANTLGIRAGAFVNAWATGDMMYCTDCHTDNDTVTPVSGPHGSQYNNILKKDYVASSSSRIMSSNEICFDCHNYNTYANDGASATVQRYSRFADSKGHGYHVDIKEYPCYACHDSHGAANKPNLIVIGRNPGIDTFVQSTGTGGMGQGSCTPTCHGNKSYNIEYAR